MSREEQNIRTAARMFEMRETAHSIFGQSYAEKVAPWKLTVSRIAERLQCGHIEAALYMANPAAGHGLSLSEFDTLLLVSAVTDLSEEPQQGPAPGPDGTGASNGSEVSL